MFQFWLNLDKTIYPVFESVCVYMIYRHCDACCVLYDRRIEAEGKVVDTNMRRERDGLWISPFTISLLVRDIDNNRHIVRAWKTVKSLFLQYLSFYEIINSNWHIVSAWWTVKSLFLQYLSFYDIINSNWHTVRAWWTVKSLFLQYLSFYEIINSNWHIVRSWWTVKSLFLQHLSFYEIINSNWHIVRT